MVTRSVHFYFVTELNIIISQKFLLKIQPIFMGNKKWLSISPALNQFKKFQLKSNPQQNRLSL